MRIKVFLLIDSSHLSALDTFRFRRTTDHGPWTMDHGVALISVSDIFSICHRLWQNVVSNSLKIRILGHHQWECA